MSEMFHRRHYKFIAMHVGYLIRLYVPEDERHDAVRSFAGALSGTNSRYKRETFEEAMLDIIEGRKP